MQPSTLLQPCIFEFFRQAFAHLRLSLHTRVDAIKAFADGITQANLDIIKNNIKITYISAALRYRVGGDAPAHDRARF